MSKLYNTIFGQKWVVIKLMKLLLVQFNKLVLIPKRSSTHGLGNNKIFGIVLKIPFHLIEPCRFHLYAVKSYLFLKYLNNSVPITYSPWLKLYYGSPNFPAASAPTLG